MGRVRTGTPGIVNGVTSSTRRKVAVRLATHASAFAGVMAGLLEGTIEHEHGLSCGAEAA